MFTGIVEATGKVVSLENKDKAWLMKVEAPKFIAEDLNIGDSLANNGCCLTVVQKEAETHEL